MSEAITDNGPKPKHCQFAMVILAIATINSLPNTWKELNPSSYKSLTCPMVTKLQNLTRFAETIAKIGDCKKITLTTKMGDTIDDTKRIQDGLEQLKAARLQDIDIDFEFTFSDLIHARYIITDNGWNTSPDRGLHIYQNIGNFYLMGYYDLDLRPCLETKIVYTKVD